MNIRCLVETKDIVGESPLWHPQEDSVYWTDINGFKINRYSPESKELRSWKFPLPVTALSLTANAKWLLVAAGPSLFFWAPATDRRLDFAQPEPDWPANRLNDGATDSAGNFWVGSMPNNVGEDGSHLDVHGFVGSLYRVLPNGEVTVADTGFGITNTLVWSPDHSTFYCGCSTRNVIYAYDYNAKKSSVSNRRVFVQDLAQGVPDGSAMDAEGCLWNCRFGGNCILRISPQGKVLQEIRMPVSNITNCAFGGDKLQTLYVTTACLMAKKEENLAGALFAIETDVRGSEADRFHLDPSLRTKLAGE
jgi:sugar lactone lactonase YvrE